MRRTVHSEVWAAAEETVQHQSQYNKEKPDGSGVKEE